MNDPLRRNSSQRRYGKITPQRMTLDAALDWIYLTIATGLITIPCLLFYATFFPSPGRTILAPATAIGIVLLVRYSPRIARFTQLAIARSNRHRR